MVTAFKPVLDEGTEKVCKQLLKTHGKHFVHPCLIYKLKVELHAPTKLYTTLKINSRLTLRVVSFQTNHIRFKSNFIYFHL